MASGGDLRGDAAGPGATPPAGRTSGLRPGRKLLQRGLPAAVSVITLGWVFTRFDGAALTEALSWNVAFVLLPALLAYGAFTLVLESASILGLLERRPAEFGAWTAARIKCASYLLAIVNYALGGAALTVLLRRRAGLGLGGGPAVRVGFAAIAGVGFFAGLVVLRAPASLGPLERLRSLAVFDALRKTPAQRLAGLLALRCVFTLCFIGVAAAAFVAFDIAIAPSRLVVGMAILAVIGALPIAVAGLGTGQIAAVYVFEGVAPPETLVALSLVLSAGLIALRAGMGMLFAREFTREALEQTRGEMP
jgi:hypothetical protein